MSAWTMKRTWTRTGLGTAVMATVLGTAGCGQSVRSESGDGIRAVPTTARLTDNAGAVFGEMTYYYEDNVVVSELDAPVGDAWAHLLTAYESVGLEPDVQDPRSYLIGVQDLRLRRSLGGRPISQYMSCGRDMTGNLADRASIRLTMVTRLQPLPEDRTQIRTELVATATDNDGTSRNVRPCASNHRLEATLARRVAETLELGREPGR